MVDLSEYQRLAARTESRTESGSLGPTYHRLSHALIGLSSEVGELADTLKRWAFYGQALSRDHVKEELGDLLWYMALVCNVLDIDMGDVPAANIRKLQARYPDRFTPERAVEANRDREAECRAMEGDGLNPLSNPPLDSSTWVPGEEP